MEYTYRNIIKEPPDAKELIGLAKLNGLAVSDLLNPKSTAYKKLGVDAEQLSQQEIAALLVEQPRALHRPLFTDGTRLIVGFKPELIEQLLEYL